MLTIALPKGRLGDSAAKLLSGAGYPVPMDGSRKLIFEEENIKYLLVKPSDVAVYVEHGAADIGIVGLDVLYEQGADVYELEDTGMGKCAMCVAAREGFRDGGTGKLRVATKYPNIAKKHFAGREISLIRLSGSIELAPLTGLSDVIVDIVETGGTLRENHLAVIEKFLPVSARLIANKSAYSFQYNEIEALRGAVRKAVNE